LKAFASLFVQLDQTNKTKEKINFLRKYLSDASDKDKLWALALFSHKRPKRQVNTSLLKLWAQELTQTPAWLFDESYHSVGDLAETISLLLPPASHSNSWGLHDWMVFLDNLQSENPDVKKERILWAWDRMSQPENFVFIKLITGGFRVGISNQLVIKALSEEFLLDSSVVSHRLMGNWSPFANDFSKLILEESPNEDNSKPYPFFLSFPIEGTPEGLGNPSDWMAEWKWDGIRSQTIVRKDDIFIWSRGEELVTDKFPELHVLKNLLPSGTVIDGEILPFKNASPMFFQDLQARIGRKNVSKKLISEIPVIIKAYDILEYKGHDIRHQPLAQRRGYLQEILVNLPENTPLLLSEPVNFTTWNGLKELQQQARTFFAEGMMVKHKMSTYQSGRKKGEWWKWKLEPFTIDAVMIYAQKGHGRRADLYSDYTFGIWDQGNLVSFAKAYSGLTDKEMSEVDRFVKQNTVEKFGPVRTVRPQLVFEIAFEGIQVSKRHKSGVALRFPRIKTWRKDKPPEEANTLEDLKQLLDQYGNHK
jgi:DNA ligase 1